MNPIQEQAKPQQLDVSRIVSDQWSPHGWGTSESESIQAEGKTPSTHIRDNRSMIPALLGDKIASLGGLFKLKPIAAKSIPHPERPSTCERYNQWLFDVRPLAHTATWGPNSVTLSVSTTKYICFQLRN